MEFPVSNSILLIWSYRAHPGYRTDLYSNTEEGFQIFIDLNLILDSIPKSVKFNFYWDQKQKIKILARRAPSYPHPVPTSVVGNSLRERTVTSRSNMSESPGFLSTFQWQKAKWLIRISSGDFCSQVPFEFNPHPNWQVSPLFWLISIFSIRPNWRT